MAGASEYITCVNDPAKALCEKARRGNSEGLPSHGGCLPLACRNVALTAENIAAWGVRPHRAPARHPLMPAAPAGRAAAEAACGDHSVPAREPPAGGIGMTTAPEALVRKKL